MGFPNRARYVPVLVSLLFTYHNIFQSAVAIAVLVKQTRIHYTEQYIVLGLPVMPSVPKLEPDS